MSISKDELVKRKEQIKKDFDSLVEQIKTEEDKIKSCLLYTSPSPRDRTRSRMPSSA